MSIQQFLLIAAVLAGAGAWFWKESQDAKLEKEEAMDQANGSRPKRPEDSSLAVDGTGKIVNNDLPAEGTITGRLLEIEELEKNNLKDGMVFSRKEEIQRFIDQIYSSTDWLYDIEVKAKEFGNPVWYQVYKDAEFMNNESRKMALAYVSQAN